jgi:hypothetical protein
LVACPKCALFMPIDDINDHLDECFQSWSTGFCERFSVLINTCSNMFFCFVLFSLSSQEDWWLMFWDDMKLLATVFAMSRSRMARLVLSLFWHGLCAVFVYTIQNEEIRVNKFLTKLSMAIVLMNKFPDLRTSKFLLN